MKLTFTKMQGCGNDYIYIDCRTTGVPDKISALAVQLSMRHLAIGADGIICICAPVTEGADALMRIFNADGSEGKMCGNGVRCVAQWLREHLLSCREKQVLLIDTKSGVKQLSYQGNQQWRVSMGEYTTLAAEIPAYNMGVGAVVNMPISVAGREWSVTCVNVGNPHCVAMVPSVAELRLEKIGPAFETHWNFPERINTEFVEVLDETHLKMRVWERGSCETFGCGTGTCAAVAAMIEQGVCKVDTDVFVESIGGTLIIRISQQGNIYMTGPAKTVYEGVADLPSFA